MADAVVRATHLVESGEITEFVRVDERLPAALAAVGLRPRDLGVLPHFTDCALVAIHLEGSDLLVYWDVDVKLSQPIDWVTPSVELMRSHRRVVVANPSWDAVEARAESTHEVGDFVLGYGFSDHAFLCRRSRFTHRGYRRVVPASWRYPLAHVVPVFEQRVDSWMRRERLLRATYLPASIEHRGPVGTQYPTATIRQRLRRSVQARVGRWLAITFPTDPRFAYYGPDDAALN